MLYEAAYWREGDRPEFEDGLSAPELRKLLADWGRTGDCALIAIDDQTPVGAAWYRFWTDRNHSYGYIANDIPELAIGVLAENRGQGVGRQLLARLLAEAHDAGIKQVSLSVEQDNPALHLYESMAFKRVAQVDNSLTMVAETTG